MICHNYEIKSRYIVFLKLKDIKKSHDNMIYWIFSWKSLLAGNLQLDSDEANEWK